MVRGAWYARVHGVAKSWTRLSDFTSRGIRTHLQMQETEETSLPSLGRRDPLEEGTVFLPGDSPWTEEPGGL